MKRKDTKEKNLQRIKQNETLKDLLWISNMKKMQTVLNFHDANNQQ